MSACYDYSPFGDSGTLPGDPDETAALGRHYFDVVNEIQAAVDSLNRIASTSDGDWIGQAGPVFRSTVGDLASRISQTKARYEATANALTNFAPQMQDAQQRAAAAAADGRAAQASLNSLNTQLSDTSNAAGTNASSQTPQEQQQYADAIRSLSNQISDASAALSDARRRFQNAVSDYHSAGQSAANQIRNAIDHDGLKDSWFQRHFEWIKKILTIAAIIITAVAIIAAICVCPLLAGIIPEALAAFMTTVATIATVATTAMDLLTTAVDVIGVTQGVSSWSNVAWDAFSDVTDGYGAIASKGIKEGVEHAGESYGEHLGEQAANETRSELIHQVITGESDLKPQDILDRMHNVQGAVSTLATHDLMESLEKDPSVMFARLLGGEDAGRLQMLNKISGLDSTVKIPQQLIVKLGIGAGMETVGHGHEIYEATQPSADPWEQWEKRLDLTKILVEAGG